MELRGVLGWSWDALVLASAEDRGDFVTLPDGLPWLCALGVGGCTMPGWLKHVPLDGANQAKGAPQAAWPGPLSRP